MAAKESCIIKRIGFFGRTVKIVMQNENGPCPLLAIANVLSLRNELKLPSGIREITQDELITAIVDLLLERSKHYEAAYAADYHQNISDIFPVLQKLTTGVDVNVKFHNLHAFEPTPEVAVFDLLGIPLVHGWLVDPQDSTTAAVFGNKSYNELVELLFLVLGDEEMELLSTGPLRNLSINSHHLHSSFSHTGSPSAVASRTASFAVSSAPGATAAVQQALQNLSLQQQQLRTSSAGGGAKAPSADGSSSSMPALGPSTTGQQQQAVVAEQQQQQQQPQLPPLRSSGAAADSSSQQSSSSSSQPQPGAPASSAEQQLLQQKAVDESDVDAVVESLVEDMMLVVCGQASPGKIELGDSPTHQNLITRRLAYDGAGPSRLNSSNKAGSSSTAAAAAAGAAQTTAASTNQAAAAGVVDSSAAAAASGGGSSSGAAAGQQQQQQEESSKASAADAAVVRAFMEKHCSQLTPFGLASMADGLKEHQLAVFFRNNHFNALFKYEGAVYLLVTDQGYVYEPDVVWERLDSVNGDTTLCNGDFVPFMPHREPEGVSTAAGPVSYSEATAGGSAAAAAAASGNLAALTDLDAAIAASLAVEGAVSEPGGRGTPGLEQQQQQQLRDEDADFALALQLQLQEEEAARVQQEREQQQQQGSRAGAQQQQPQQQPVLESLGSSMRQMSQRFAAGVQEQYAAATGSAGRGQVQGQWQQAGQQQQQQQAGRRRSGSSCGAKRTSAHDEKCSMM